MPNSSLIPSMTVLPTEADLKTRCRRIFIRRLTLDCRIGAYEYEKQRHQKVIFDCDVWVPLSKSTSNSDHLDDVLNYDLIVGKIRDTALSKHFNLQETLLDETADRLMTIPGIVLLRLSSAKTEAYPDAEAAGIEIWRTPVLSPLF